MSVSVSVSVYVMYVCVCVCVCVYVCVCVCVSVCAIVSISVCLFASVSTCLCVCVRPCERVVCVFMVLEFKRVFVCFICAFFMFLCVCHRKKLRAQRISTYIITPHTGFKIYWLAWQARLRRAQCTSTTQGSDGSIQKHAQGSDGSIHSLFDTKDSKVGSMNSEDYLKQQSGRQSSSDPPASLCSGTK